MTSFIFQQPGSAKLFEAISTAADGADAGGGVFAFASSSGVEALFSSLTLQKMLKHRKAFRLVVGVDAITNAEALLCIADKRALHGKALTAEVFFHKNPASTFHPKFAWFLKGDELHLITGSGNLTLRGLGKQSSAIPAPGNWEAFSVQEFTGANAQTTVLYIDGWLTAQRDAGALCQLDDEKVKVRAMANGLIRYTSGSTQPKGSTSTSPKTPHTAPVDDTGFEAQDILVRELPKTRLGQADVGQKALKSFFGYAGTPKDILLQYVTLTDQLGPAEKIRLFVNDSKNYRLELREIVGLGYDIAADDSRMILVATKLDRRSFRYTIVPVTSPDHAQLLALLGPGKSGRRLMREKRLTGEELRKGWHDVPANLVPVVTTAAPP